MLLHMSLAATIEYTKSGDQHDLEHMCVPNPTMIDTWAVHKLCRDVHEEPMQPTLMLEPSTRETFALGQHSVRRCGVRLACEECARVYSVRHTYRYAYVKYEHADKPKPAKLPPPPEPAKQVWQIPKHSKRPHKYDVAASKTIGRHTCKAQWQWSQRHRLAFSVCAGSTHAEETRRQGVDWELPLQRRGHMVALHPKGNFLVCTICGLKTGGEKVRTIDRFGTCPGFPGH